MRAASHECSVTPRLISNMSEEQSNFKVTDRRLFNADGTPREVAREEASAAVAATAAPTAHALEAKDASPSGASVAPAASVESATQAERPDERAQSSDAPATQAAEHTPTAQDKSLEDDPYAEGELPPGVDDPTSFVSLLMSLASNAAAALGMMEHPVTGQRAVDIQLGKYWIDTLGMLQQKTRGNLLPQEQQIFEGLLADLRMQYVSLTSAPSPKQPGVFKGSDITGGK